ncbi:MAG: hypothetical protein KA116_07965 [Proteobacteria bacterium]|nr:hypothetical protein [Pseudomonadota bacterium]
MKKLKRGFCFGNLFLIICCWGNANFRPRIKPKTRPSSISLSGTWYQQRESTASASLKLGIDEVYQFRGGFAKTASRSTEETWMINAGLGARFSRINSMGVNFSFEKVDVDFFAPGLRVNFKRKLSDEFRGGLSLGAKRYNDRMQQLAAGGFDLGLSLDWEFFESFLLYSEGSISKYNDPFLILSYLTLPAASVSLGLSKEFDSFSIFTEIQRRSFYKNSRKAQSAASLGFDWEFLEGLSVGLEGSSLPSFTASASYTW